jgi:fluoride exporter
VLRSDPREAAAILAGGALGARVRTGLVVAFPSHGWPWATFAVNLAGAFALGYFVTRLQERLPLSAYKRPLLGTGFCGALTTFSTVQVELLDMLDGHRYGLALGYTAATLGCGYLAVLVATGLVRRTRVIA